MERVLGLSFRDLEAVLGFSFRDLKGVLGLSFRGLEGVSGLRSQFSRHPRIKVHNKEPKNYSV